MPAAQTPRVLDHDARGAVDIWEEVHAICNGASNIHESPDAYLERPFPGAV
jgi:hypothetical protein